MKSPVARVSAVCAVVAGFAAISVFARQAPAARDFDAEIRVALAVGQGCGRV